MSGFWLGLLIGLWVGTAAGVVLMGVIAGGCER